MPGGENPVRRATAIAAVLACACLVLAGCGLLGSSLFGGGGGGSPSPTPSPSPSPTPTPGPRALQVVSTTPEDGATDVAVNTAITITFSAPVRRADACDAVTIDPDPQQAYSCSSASGGRGIRLTGGLLSAGTDYTVTVEAGLRGTDGSVLLAPYTFTFRTRAAGSAVTVLVPAAAGFVCSNGAGATGQVRVGDDEQADNTLNLCGLGAGQTAAVTGFVAYALPAALRDPGVQIQSAVLAYSRQTTAGNPWATWASLGVQAGPYYEDGVFDNSDLTAASYASASVAGGPSAGITPGSLDVTSMLRLALSNGNQNLGLRWRFAAASNSNGNDDVETIFPQQLIVTYRSPFVSGASRRGRP
jgi:hypothetical protein